MNNRVLVLILLALICKNSISSQIYFALENINIEEIEIYRIDLTRCSGTALLLDNNAQIHRVIVGDSIGPNRGEITAIIHDRIIFEEIVSGESGEYDKREAALLLTPTGETKYIYNN